MSDPTDTVARVVARLRSRGPTSSVLEDADRVLRRAEPRVRRAVQAITRGSAEQVEDLVQQTLEIAWRRLPEFDASDEPGIEAWIRGIARNVCSNDRRRRSDLLCDDGLVEVGDPSHSVLTALQQQERDDIVTAAIGASLQGIEQDVLYHRYVHGLEREHIAELLGLADANEVRVVMQRAQRRLKAELERTLVDLGHGRSFVRTLE